MIRIWNYNKNRIHSYRGVRYLQITLDDEIIFRGEIQRAAGKNNSSFIIFYRVCILVYSIFTVLGTTSTDVELCSECILFTTNPSILGLIEKYDPIAQLAIKKKRELDLLEAKKNVSKTIYWGDVVSHLDAFQEAKTPKPLHVDGNSSNIYVFVFLSVISTILTHIII